MNPPPTLNSQAIERIVREVLARLRGMSASPASPSGSSPAAAEAGLVNVSDRVITLHSLKEHWQGLRRLQVKPGAVVTPAVRDELRERGIALQYGDASPDAKTTWKTFACRQDARSVSVARTTPALRTQTTESDAETFVAAAKHALSHRCSGVITTKPSLALCELNQRANIRAVCGANREALQEAIRLTQPNVLILDPRILNPHQLIQQLEMFHEPH